MKREDIDFVLAAMPRGRTVYYDFVDRYAIMLLGYAIGANKVPIARIKKTHLAPLLEKPVLKSLLASLGRAWICSDDLLSAWPANTEGYRLTLGTWPDLEEKPNRRWSQVTRWGWSLVLQLNVSTSHRRMLGAIVEDWKTYNEYSPHPIAKGQELTLAWSRLDLDFETSEALIEEIQSDWIRDVTHYAQAQWLADRGSWSEYLQQVLMPQARRWPQTMLTATLWLLLEELGIKTIFYHTYDSGVKLKNLKDSLPPRSIYTRLPKQFCFQTTHYGPNFLRDTKDKELRELFTDPDTKWYIHNFDEKR